MATRHGYYLRGETVRRIADEHHLTQSVLAIKLGISVGYLSQLINGRPLTPRMRNQFLHSRYFHAIAESELWTVLELEGTGP